MIRSFDWRDFPKLHRYRNHGVWLDNRLALTQWLALVPAGAMLAYIAPATGIYTYLAEQEPGHHAPPMIGQFVYQNDADFAHLTFLAPSAAVNSPAVPELLDYLARESGKHGAKNLLAEIHEDSNIFEVLRNTGYAVYTRQQVWQIEQTSISPAETTAWREVQPKDELSIRALYSSNVPPLVQQTEPAPWENLNGFVYYQKDKLTAYCHLIEGPRGMIAQLFVDHEIDHLTERLADLFADLPGRRARPLYVVIRSHQGWLTPAMHDLNASPGPHQAVMVKRMTVPNKVDLSIKLPATGLENARPEASVYSNAANQKTTKVSNSKLHL